MGPIVEEIVNELGIDFEKIDASKDYELADKYGVSAVPTYSGQVFLRQDNEN